MTLYGFNGQTSEFLVTANGLQKGASFVIDKNEKNIGDLYKVSLRTTGTDAYRCHDITVL